MDNDYVVIVDGELYHYGTKGMKWGRRLFQNKDGSLTALGKKRYLNSDGTLNKAGKKMRKEEADALKAREAAVKKRESEARQKVRQDAKKAELDAREKALDSGKVPKSTKAAQKAAAAETKSMKDMTNTELKEAIARKQLEDQYRQAFPQQIPKGKQIVDKLANDVIKPALVEGGKNIMTSMLDRVADKIDPYSKKALQATYDKLELQAKIEDLTKGKPWHRLTADEKAKMYKLERDKLEDARKDAAYAEGAENRKLARDKDRAEAKLAIQTAENNAKKNAITAKQDRIAAEEALRKKKQAIANDRKIEQDAADAKKQAEKDARNAEKQAKKDAKTAEKQAKKDAEAKAEAEEMAIRTSRSSGENALLKRLGYDSVQRSERIGQTNVTSDTRKKSNWLADTEYDSMDYPDSGKTALTKLLNKPAATTTTSTSSNSKSVTSGTSAATIQQIRRMTKMGNKTYAEIASQLGVSESTVKNYARGEDVVSRLLGK